MRVTLALLLVVGLAAPAVASQDSAEPEHRRAVYERMLEQIRGLDLPARVDALVRLAWPEQTNDEELAAMARDLLVEYGHDAVPGLRKAIRTVTPIHQADVVATLLEGFERAGGALSNELSLALDDALWYGDRESKRLAMREAARRRYQQAVLPIMDAAVEYPELTEDAIEALGHIGAERARFFIGQRLIEGSGPIRTKAAIALSRIGGLAREPLREAALSEDAELREVAIQAMLSSATPDDLYVFHDFVDRYGASDPRTAEAVRSIAAQLEEYLEQRNAQQDVP